MNKRDLSVRMEFVTIEDISGVREEMNYVVLNFNKEPEERMEEFKTLMRKRYNHEFTDEELERLSQFSNPLRAGEFIQCVRKILFHQSD